MPNSANSGVPTRIVIADDHPIFRFGLKRLLETESDFSIVGEAADGVTALHLVRDLKPDVLLLDLAMPRLGGMDALVAMEVLTTRAIILTAAISDNSVARAFQLGARGVLLKETASRQLVDTIRRVVEGRYVVDDGVVDDLVTALRRLDRGRHERRFNLTGREQDIIRAIVAGQSNKEIAAHLRISAQTVKHHLTSIFDKTGVSGRLELAVFALRHRLGDDD
jgi:two-component system nitrate/nitrite response regulator NarL